MARGAKKEINELETVSFEEALAELAGFGEKYELIIESAEKARKLLSKLAKARKNKELSQRDLAEIVNIKQPQLARYESCESMPRLDTLLRIAEALDLQVSLNEKFETLSFSTEGTYDPNSGTLFKVESCKVRGGVQA